VSCIHYPLAVSIILENGGEKFQFLINPLNAELNLICHLLALLGAHPILHISRIRVKGILVTESFGCVYQGSRV
jgi:hypothetical protein